MRVRAERRAEVRPLPAAGLLPGENERQLGTLPVKEAKKPRRQEQLTVFFLSCGSRYAVRRRPDTGLLAGLWELPNTEGTLSAQQALSLLEQWGLQPEQLQKVIERTHVFTHVEWHMRCCYVRVAEPGRGLYLGGRRGIFAQHRLPDGLPDVLGAGRRGRRRNNSSFFVTFRI